MPEAIPDSSYSKKTLHSCSLFYFILHAIVSMLMVVLLLFCVYVSVRLFCAEACVYEAVHVCAHMWKPENNIRYHLSFLRLYPPMFGNKSLSLVGHYYSKGCAELQRSAHILCPPIPAMELTGYATTHSFVCFKTWVLRSNSDFHVHRAIHLLAESSTQSYVFIWTSGNILPHVLFFLVKIALSSLVYFSPDTYCVYVCLFVCMCLCIFR